MTVRVTNRNGLQATVVPFLKIYYLIILFGDPGAVTIDEKEKISTPMVADENRVGRLTINKNQFFSDCAIPIKCFVSHRPVSCDGGSVGRAEKKWENEHLKGSGFQRRPGCEIRKPDY